MPMLPNPGGQLDPENIVGREELIEHLWTTLEGRCVYMNDLRRVGKTMILRKMAAAPPSGWVAVKRDLGGCHSAAEFATQTYRDTHSLLGVGKKAQRRMAQLLGALHGAEIVGVLKLPDGSAAPWKEVLNRTFADLNEDMGEGRRRTVLLWDEVPFLLSNVSEREGPAVAMEILDTLRALSQDYDRVRMVLTGSVGLHHVLASLRAQGYINSPLNHMEHIAPGPLEPTPAVNLALALLEGANLSCSDRSLCAKAIAEAVGYVPFYIHKLISRLPSMETIAPETITATLRREIAHADNDWDLVHYRTRLPIYYEKNEKLALHLLDAVAVASGPLDFETVYRQVSGQVRSADRERVRSVARLLEQDHYLCRDAKGHYAFRFSLIATWWRFDRSLGQR